MEAQAARRYWPLLFGKEFRRDPRAEGINGLLNYAYAILRSLAARAVMAAGLHPALGVHHHNRSNPMCLVDDVMEPFRPLADWLVFGLVGEGVVVVNNKAKTRLAALGMLDMQGEKGISPLSSCLRRLASSLGQSYESGKNLLVLPPPWLAGAEGREKSGHGEDFAKEEEGEAEQVKYEPCS